MRKYIGLRALVSLLVFEGACERDRMRTEVPVQHIRNATIDTIDFKYRLACGASCKDPLVDATIAAGETLELIFPGTSKDAFNGSTGSLWMQARLDLVVPSSIHACELSPFDDSGYPPHEPMPAQYVFEGDACTAGFIEVGMPQIEP
jgi:hypothetical protein